jgi:hypothetical protein
VADNLPQTAIIELGDEEGPADAPGLLSWTELIPTTGALPDRISHLFCHIYPQPFCYVILADTTRLTYAESNSYRFEGGGGYPLHRCPKRETRPLTFPSPWKTLPALEHLHEAHHCQPVHKSHRRRASRRSGCDRQAGQGALPAQWGVTATLKVIRLPLGRKKAPVEKDTDAVIYFGDSSNDPDTGVDDAEGYHSSNNKDIPYGFVYLDICAKAKDAWSCAHLRTGCAAQMGRPGSRTGLLSLCSRKHS